MVEHHEHRHKPVYAPFNWFVGVDGSEWANKCYEVVRNNLFRESSDHLTVAHVRDEKKTYLSFHFKPDYIQETYETHLIDLGKKGEFAMVDKLDGKTTKEMLWELAQERKANIICTSMVGRKGPKA
jgi:hypothetical protein